MSWGCKAARHEGREGDPELWCSDQPNPRWGETWWRGLGVATMGGTQGDRLSLQSLGALTLEPQS